ncbi:hypothetical protein Golax_001208, partial [Gossypium laxum]|nr:hypothetical protein [Gossypium laxum]
VNRGPFKDALVGKKGGENKDSSTLKDDDDLELLDRDIITGEEDDMPSIQFSDHSDYFLVKFQSIKDYIEALTEGLREKYRSWMIVEHRKRGDGWIFETTKGGQQPMNQHASRFNVLYDLRDDEAKILENHIPSPTNSSSGQRNGIFIYKNPLVEKESLPKHIESFKGKEKMEVVEVKNQSRVSLSNIVTSTLSRSNSIKACQSPEINMVMSKVSTKFISKFKNLGERDMKISLDPKHHFVVSFYKNSDLNIPEDMALVERNFGTGMESDLQRHQQMGSANQILKKPPNILKNKGRNFKVPGLFKVPISEAMNRIVDSLKSTLAIEDLMELMEIDGIKATSDDL